MKRWNQVICFLFSASAMAAVPSVSQTEMTQAEDREVTVKYTLSNGPAVITLDVQTNGPSGWVSIGGRSLCGGDGIARAPVGDVWRRVKGDTEHTIRWVPDETWPDMFFAGGSVRAVVSAWALTNTPAYLVVPLVPANTADTTFAPARAFYYPAVDYLPGGLLSNNAYRTSLLVMRKIPARGVKWTAGSTTAEVGRTGNEAQYELTLTNDYYMGVFELTQAQAHGVQHNILDNSKFKTEGAMRPIENISFNEMRTAYGIDGNEAYNPPNPPGPESILHRMRALTVCEDFPEGIDLDLPRAREWEFACRGGYGNKYFNNGAEYTAKDMIENLPGRYRYTQADTSYNSQSPDGATMGPENGTAIVGSYEPNYFGLYDMHGNVHEICLDSYHWTASNDATYVDGVNTNGASYGFSREMRGGAWSSDAVGCRSACRASWPRDNRGGSGTLGFRLSCRGGLK